VMNAPGHENETAGRSTPSAAGRFVVDSQAVDQAVTLYVVVPEACAPAFQPSVRAPGV
jgi:hypothetical protein